MLSRKVPICISVSMWEYHFLFTLNQCWIIQINPLPFLLWYMKGASFKFHLLCEVKHFSQHILAIFYLSVNFLNIWNWGFTNQITGVKVWYSVFFLTGPLSLQDLSSPTEDGPCAPCSGEAGTCRSCRADSKHPAPAHVLWTCVSPNLALKRCYSIGQSTLGK